MKQNLSSLERDQSHCLREKGRQGDQYNSVDRGVGKMCAQGRKSVSSPGKDWEVQEEVLSKLGLEGEVNIHWTNEGGKG